MVTQEMSRAGLKQEYVRTESILTLEEKKHRWHIAGIQLNVTADVAQAHAEKFEHACKSAKTKCPISCALKTTIKMTTQLQAAPHAVAA
jgi:organic hydroperoxide reductase OsmC/OhrA